MRRRVRAVAAAVTFGCAAAGVAVAVAYAEPTPAPPGQAASSARTGVPTTAPAASAPSSAAPATGQAPSQKGQKGSGTSPTTTSPGPTSTTPSTAPTPGVVSACDGPTVTGGHPKVEPGSIVIACADDGLSLVNLTWSSWTASSATGHGTLRYNLCTPDCAEGTIASYPATVTLSGLVDTADGQAFSQATLAYTGGGPTTRTGRALDVFTLWYPGI